VVTPELTSGYVVSVNNATHITAIEGNTNEGPVFNLAGQRVEKARKGLYIQKGKKYVVK
jgi:hypothetical protein